MAEDDIKTAELKNDELEEVAGGVDPGEHGYPCTICGSTNTTFDHSEDQGGLIRYVYQCNDCWIDFDFYCSED